MTDAPPDSLESTSRGRARVEAELKRRAGFAVNWLAARGVKPDHVTLAGLAITLAAAPLVAFGWLFPGGLLFLFGSALDGLDGELARRDEDGPTPFGSVLDATADRIGEGSAFVALAAWFAANGEALPAAATVLALVGANLTSYVRARAEAAGGQCRSGLCTRLERVCILGIGITIHQPAMAIYLLTVLTIATALQRLLAVRKSLA